MKVIAFTALFITLVLNQALASGPITRVLPDGRLSVSMSEMITTLATKDDRSISLDAQSDGSLGFKFSINNKVIGTDSGYYQVVIPEGLIVDEQFATDNEEFVHDGKVDKGVWNKVLTLRNKEIYYYSNGKFQTCAYEVSANKTALTADCDGGIKKYLVASIDSAGQLTLANNIFVLTGFFLDMTVDYSLEFMRLIRTTPNAPENFFEKFTEELFESKIGSLRNTSTMENNVLGENQQVLAEIETKAYTEMSALVIHGDE